jgi:hypothetical protein
METASSRSSSIATADIGLWLRGFLEVLLADPGGLYNPVYFGPLSGGETLAEAVRGAAAAGALPVANGPAPPGAGVWLAEAKEADSALASGATPRPGVQWVVWSRASVSALPDRVAGWIGAEGLALDLREGPGEFSSGPSLGRAVGAACDEAARQGVMHLVLAVGDEHDLGSLAAELQLHLELVWDEAVPRGSCDGWSPGERHLRARVLVVAHGTDVDGLCERLVTAGVAGGPAVWGLVLDADSAERLGKLPGWRALAARASWLRLASRPGLAVDESAFLPLSELVGLAWSGCEPEGVVRFDLAAVSLPEILQSAEGWSRSGTLVVFGPDRAGYVQVGGGRVGSVAIHRVGELSPGSEEGRFYCMLATLASWSDAGVVFVPGEVPARGIAIGRVVMGVTHLLGEIGRAHV